MFRRTRILFALVTILFLAEVSPITAFADNAKQINANVESSLKKFEEVTGSKDILRRAEGMLVFPNVYKA
ncbi:MAG: hypothetical protein V1490_00760, partial [Candidatus Omnitrophota bacterium]